MAAIPKPNSISPTQFLKILSRFESLTGLCTQAAKQTYTESNLEGLQQLESWRVYTLPVIVSARAQESSPYITHDELVTIMKCKMYALPYRPEVGISPLLTSFLRKRGKFRPQLLPQVTSNAPSTVKKITAEAFAYNKELKDDKEPELNDVKSALTHLSKNLKGVGPATASYLLAAQMPNWVPAFSDEGFRWVFFDKHLPGVIEKTSSSTDGWRRPIKYSLKEYFAYVEEVNEISNRLISEYQDDCEEKAFKGRSPGQLFGAGSVEIVGWVLGKEEAGWKPVDTEKAGNSSQENQNPKTAKDTKLHEKRKHHGDPEEKEGLEVDNQSTEVGGGEVSKAPSQHELKRSKKEATEYSAGGDTTNSQASKSNALRRSSRLEKRSTS